jgi:hypothetical protein
MFFAHYNLHADTVWLSTGDSGDLAQGLSYGECS